MAGAGVLELAKVFLLFLPQNPTVVKLTGWWHLPERNM